MEKTFAVYILASRSRRIYTGVTNNLNRRMLEHRQGLVDSFTKRYRIHRLVYFETFRDVRSAIAREKEIKGWDREVGCQDSSEKQIPRFARDDMFLVMQVVARGVVFRTDVRTHESRN
jgi:putative endonuclease